MRKIREIKIWKFFRWIFIIILIVLAGFFLMVGMFPSLQEEENEDIILHITPPVSPTPCFVISIPWWSTLEVNIGDGGLITKDPCAPPCFMNITPGMTTESEVYQILEERGITEWCEPRREDCNPYSIICRYIIVNFPEQGDTVSSILLSISQALEMKDIIQEYGPPDRVFTLVGEIPDALEFLDMWIYYDDILAEIRLETQKINENWYYRVSESTLVGSISYYDEEGYKNDILYIHASPWQGYGEYRGEWFPSVDP